MLVGDQRLHPEIPAGRPAARPETPTRSAACALPSSLPAAVGWERRDSGRSRDIPGRDRGAAGRTIPRAGAARRPPRRAEAAPAHRRMSLRCPLAHLERHGLYFCRPRRMEPPAAVRLPMQVQARVTEGKGGERGKETPNPPCPAPLPGIHCPPSPEALRHPVGAAAAGKRRSARPGTPPAAAVRRGSGRAPRCSRAGAAAPGRRRAAGAGCGRAALAVAAAGTGTTSRWGRGARHGPRLRGRGALHRPRLLPIRFFFLFSFYLFVTPCYFCFLVARQAQ